MARPHVPRFGAWDHNSANGPTMYTAVFDEARAAKGGKLINPNDPAENPDLIAMYHNPASAPPQGSNEQPAPRRRYNMTSVNNHDQGQQAVRDGNNEGSGHTPEHSPLHPRANREGARESAGQAAGVGSEARTPRNVRVRTPAVARVEEPARRGSPLPEFGRWNTDPTAVEEYTAIFNQHKNEKRTGEAVRNRRSNPSPARNSNKSHRSGTSSKKDKYFCCTIL